MKIFVALCILALGIPLSAQQEQSDPYSINLIRTALNLQAHGIHMSITDKRISWRGDGTAIALVKIYSEQELSNPHSVATYLPLIQESFSQPQLISTNADRKPNVTLFLLKYLQQHTSDIQTQRSIEETIKFVETKTANLGATR